MFCRAYATGAQRCRICGKPGRMLSKCWCSRNCRGLDLLSRTLGLLR